MRGRQVSLISVFWIISAIGGLCALLRYEVLLPLVGAILFASFGFFIVFLFVSVARMTGLAIDAMLNVLLGKHTDQDNNSE